MISKYKVKLENALKNRSFFETIQHALIKRWPFWMIQNGYVLDLQMQARAYKKLKKEYANIIEQTTVLKSPNNHKFPKIIWWCWLQGFEQAPELVKICYESLKKNMPDYEIRILTNDNLDSYIDIPHHVISKYKKGIIGAAHFSDIVRLEVLIKYGGIWIDSTVYCTGSEMCDVIENTELFVYQDINNPFISASNWLIAARPGNEILILTEKLLIEFWKTHEVATHYYIFHFFFDMARKKYSELWGKIPVYENCAPHIMVRELNMQYSESRMRELKEISSFHKLNYKLDFNCDRESMYGTLFHFEH